MRLHGEFVKGWEEWWLESMMTAAEDSRKLQVCCLCTCPDDWLKASKHNSVPAERKEGLRGADSRNPTYLTVPLFVSIVSGVTYDRTTMVYFTKYVIRVPPLYLWSRSHEQYYVNATGKDSHRRRDA